MYCNTNQLPALLFGGPHSKSHGARGLSKHYHLRFDLKLDIDVCAILFIPCACVACTPMLFNLGYQVYYQMNNSGVNKGNYWPLLWSFNNWNIIPLSQKSTPSDEFYEIHQVVLDGISDNMA